MPGSEVVLFARPNCPLCDDVSQQLTLLGVSFTTTDIARDHGLTEEYGLRVPVVTVGGEEVFEGGMSPSELREVFGGS